jgi:predicted metal-dependent phosphoesterase TrpH
LNHKAKNMGATGRLRPYRVDLHIHTALSPCASSDMTPSVILAAAREKGLDMIAICDHNATGNVGAVQEAALATGGRPVVIAGMELTTSEEVHVLGLFPDTAAADRVAARVAALLPQITGLLRGGEQTYRSHFGQQTLLDSTGRSRGEETVALALATTLDLASAVALIHHEKGVAVAAHIDRPSFSVYSQLGFFPLDAGLDAAEVSRRLPDDSPRWSSYRELGLPLLRSSDSHFPEEIGTTSSLCWMRQPSFAELVLCLAGAGGRRLEVAAVSRVTDTTSGATEEAAENGCEGGGHA